MTSVLATTDVLDEKGGISDPQVLARLNGDLSMVSAKEVEYIDISPKQIVGVSAAMIPFLEHDDANRALMGSNMQRQAVPLLQADPPLVATGMERVAGEFSGMIIKARRGGEVTYVDSERVIIDNADEYLLESHRQLNERTCQKHSPIVSLGQKVEAGQILADGSSTKDGELAIGKNALVAFNTFDGYNFEDAIVISERLVKDDVLTSVHIESFDVEVRDTKLGREEFTDDIPNVSEKQLKNLNDTGIIREGARVGPGDILVGKVSPKSKSELTPEEKLLHAIFGRAGEDVKNDSLDVPAGSSGIVINTRHFSRRMHLNDEQKAKLKEEMGLYEEEMNDKAIELFKQMIDRMNETLGAEMVDPATRQKVGVSDIPEVVLEQIENFDEKWVKGSKDAKAAAMTTYSQFWPRIKAIEEEKDRVLAHKKRGDELQSGVLEMVKVYLANRRQIAVGDKMAGRHGNKGVVARIVPEEDMPFLEDGTPVDILLNPLGVPSRMNVGQLLELHLGWAAQVLGFQGVTPAFDGASEAEVLGAIDEANKSVDDRIAHFEETGQNPVLQESCSPSFHSAARPSSTTDAPAKPSTSPHRWTCTCSSCITWWMTRFTHAPQAPTASSRSSHLAARPAPAASDSARWKSGPSMAPPTFFRNSSPSRATMWKDARRFTTPWSAARTRLKPQRRLLDVLCHEIRGLGMNIDLEKQQTEGSSLL